MDSATGRTIGEAAFYVAVAALLVLLLIKKYRQAKNAEKDKPEQE